MNEGNPPQEPIDITPRRIVKNAIKKVAEGMAKHPWPGFDLPKNVGVKPRRLTVLPPQEKPLPLISFEEKRKERNPQE